MAFPAISGAPLSLVIVALLILREQSSRDQFAIFRPEFGVNRFPGVAIEKVRMIPAVMLARGLQVVAHLIDLRRHRLRRGGGSRFLFRGICESGREQCNASEQSKSDDLPHV
jgi:hypothetical protein